MIERYAASFDEAIQWFKWLHSNSKSQYGELLRNKSIDWIASNLESANALFKFLAMTA